MSIYIKPIGIKFNKYIITFFVLGMTIMSSTNSVFADTMSMQQSRVQ